MVVAEPPDVNVTVEGLNEAIGPFATTGAIETVSDTLPANPSMLVSPIVEVAEEPGRTAKDEGEASREKPENATLL